MDNQMDNLNQRSQESTNEWERVISRSQMQRDKFYKKNEKSINIIIRFMKYVKNRMDDIRRQQDEYDESYHFCSFCGEDMSRCREGGDHSFEMRLIMREACRGERW